MLTDAIQLRNESDSDRVVDFYPTNKINVDVPSPVEEAGIGLLYGGRCTIKAWGTGYRGCLV